MSYKLKNTSFLKLIFKGVVSNRMVIMLLLLVLAAIVGNVLVSLSLKEVSSKFFNTVLKIDYDEGSAQLLFRSLMVFVFVHYLLSTLIDFLKSTIAIHLFHASLRDAVNEMVHMENTAFHEKSSGKHQEDVTKSSWAMFEAAGLLLVSIPMCLIYFFMYGIKIFFFFNPRASAVYFSAVLLCMVTVFFISLFVTRYENFFIVLYKNSLVFLTDILGNFDVVQAFNKEDAEVAQYDHAVGGFCRSVRRYLVLRETISFLQKCSLMIPHFAIVYLFLLGFDIGMSAGDLFLYNAIFMSFKNNFVSMRDHIFTLAKRCAELEPRLSHRVKDESGTSALGGFSDAIVLDSAELCAGEQSVNKNLSFTIRKGEKVAITGMNGCGKSTFFKTILRFYSNKGLITVDGRSIESISDRSLRSLVGYVPQDHHIFNNTVLYNLGYGQEKYDEQEIYRICSEYGLHDFFKSLPNGYLTQAGENGKYLSGGQKQRINFMRAIIRGSPILVLDEPTSNLDKTSEAEIISKIFTHCADKTVLVIIHNLDLLKKFQKILYFKRDDAVVYDSYDEFIAAK